MKLSHVCRTRQRFFICESVYKALKMNIAWSAPEDAWACTRHLPIALSPPENKRRWPNFGLTLAHRLRLWANVNPTLDERFVLGWVRSSDLFRSCCWITRQRVRDTFSGQRRNYQYTHRLGAISFNVHYRLWLVENNATSLKCMSKQYL